MRDILALCILGMLAVTLILLVVFMILCIIKEMHDD